MASFLSEADIQDYGSDLVDFAPRAAGEGFVATLTAAAAPARLAPYDARFKNTGSPRLLA
jgi:hypothetical protein